MPKKTSYLKLLLAAVLLQVTAASPVFSGAPLKINFQGRLDENGQPAEGSKTLIFKVYDAVSGGTLVWTSAAQALTLSNGVFSALLSAGSPAALSTATFAGARYVEMSVDGVTLSPRQEMVSAPYAIVAQALAPDAELPASSIADGSVTDAKVSLTTAAISSGRFSDDRVLITTGAFAALNGADQLVKLDGSGYLPALNGSALTNVNSAQFNAVASDTSTIAGNLAAEITNRGSADSALSSRLDDVATDTATLAGQLSVKAEYADVIADTSTIAGNLAAEITNRGSADSALSSRLDDVATDTATLAGQLSVKAEYADVIADTSTIAGNLAAEITNRGSADSALSSRLDDVATDTDTLAGSLSGYAGLASTQIFTGVNTFIGSSSFASTSAFTAQHAISPAVTVSSGLVVAAGYVGIGTASPNSMLNVAGAVSLAIKTITNADSPYSLTAADSTILVDGDTGASDATTINLPDASLVPGRIYTFKRIDPEGIGYTYSVDITPFPGQGIEEGPGYSLNTVQWQTVTLQSYGTGWIILHSN